MEKERSIGQNYNDIAWQKYDLKTAFPEQIGNVDTVLENSRKSYFRTGLYLPQDKKRSKRNTRYNFKRHNTQKYRRHNTDEEDGTGETGEEIRTRETYEEDETGETYEEDETGETDEQHRTEEKDNTRSWEATDEEDEAKNRLKKNKIQNCPTDGFFPDLSSCKFFHYCWNGMDYGVSCSRKSQVYRPRMDRVLKQSKTNKCFKLNCKRKGNKKVPFEGDRHIYALCYRNKPREICSCPDGTIFYERSQSCLVKWTQEL